MEMEERAIKPRIGIVNFERRRHPRFNIDLPIEYYPIDSSISHSGRAINISEGGLLVYLPEKVEVGQYLKMKLFFPLGSDLNTIEMVGQLVWMDIHLEKGWGDYRSGVRFIDISSEDLNKLKKFLKTLSE
jgi:c-di-GMP-binding flagellar brake protein YcgR